MLAPRRFANGVAKIMLGLALASSAARAAEPMTIATAEYPAPPCAVGQSCTFSSPIFACDYANAEQIAAAGSVNGRAIGSRLAGANICQTVPPGRPVATEATKSAKVVYLTRDGQHLGYMPVGVFAPGGSGPQLACAQPGFCAVRPGATAFFCPEARSLALPSPEAKSSAKCLRLTDSNAGEVVAVNDNVLTFANMFGGKPPYASRYYGARADFIGLNLQPRPTPAERGWCRPNTWCVTVASTLFCNERAAYQAVEAMPPGEPRRLAIQREPGCRIVVAGNALKRRKFCQDHWGDGNPSSFATCMAEPDLTLAARANCETKRISWDGQSYGLFERPRDAAPDINTDQSRQWLFRNLKSGDWLDGSTLSGEATVGTAYNALCPGADPDASYGVVYHDTRAKYPRELQGRWFADRRACADPKRNASSYNEYIWMAISDGTANGRPGSKDRLNAIRPLGQGRWEIDEESRSQEDTPEFSTVIYALTRAGITTKVEGRTTLWIACR